MTLDQSPSLVIQDGKIWHPKGALLLAVEPGPYEDFVHRLVPITWGEATSLLSVKMGTRAECSRASLKRERLSMGRLTWSWSQACKVQTGEMIRKFASGDVVRFAGREEDGSNTALVGEARN